MNLSSIFQQWHHYPSISNLGNLINTNSPYKSKYSDNSLIIYTQNTNKCYVAQYIQGRVGTEFKSEPGPFYTSAYDTLPADLCFGTTITFTAEKNDNGYSVFAKNPRSWGIHPYWYMCNTWYFYLYSI